MGKCGSPGLALQPCDHRQVIQLHDNSAKRGTLSSCMLFVPHQSDILVFPNENANPAVRVFGTSSGLFSLSSDLHQ